MILTFLSKHKRTVLGIILGAVAGYFYFVFVGCTGGTCPITSQPLHSTLYGALMGGLLVNSVTK